MIRHIIHECIYELAESRPPHNANQTHSSRSPTRKSITIDTKLIRAQETACRCGAHHADLGSSDVSLPSRVEAWAWSKPCRLHNVGLDFRVFVFWVLSRFGVGLKLQTPKLIQIRALRSKLPSGAWMSTSKSNLARV